MQSLLPSLPYRLNSKTKTDVTYHIRALANVYTPVASKTATQTYLSELKDIAKQTGKDFAAVLREELSLISETVDLDHSESQDEDAEQNLPDTPEQNAPENAAHVSLLPIMAPQQHVQHHWSSPSTPSKEKTQPALKLSDVNPSDIQKVIVEHIVRNEDSALQVHTSLRLRPFSGRVPRPNSEVDYETWRSNVELLLKDMTQSDLYKSRKLLESLLSPAIDIVKHLTPDSPFSAYLEILDSAFGTVEDGDDLFAKYLNTMQDNGEKPSAYLQRLQVMLSTTLRRGGVIASDLDRHLLRQFVRGCWDNILIAELQLEQKKQNPPTFAELLLLLRTAEDKRSSKASRMKQHFNVSKPRVSSHYQGVYMQSEEDC
ncbi:modulator of apoptosis 1, partial [Austrofundulus limnaeus]|uniref:Modulator of apoptosis 1 n=1 Tax=Austrofundulus limnaeus TaxID=52670 RepID=A0A2I4AKE5_AUSLI